MDGARVLTTVSVSAEGAPANVQAQSVWSQNRAAAPEAEASYGKVKGLRAPQPGPRAAALRLSGGPVGDAPSESSSL